MYFMNGRLLVLVRQIMRKRTETDIYFRAREVTDEIVTSRGHERFNEFIDENQRAAELVANLGSEEHARQMFELTSALDPDADRRALLSKLHAARRHRSLRRALRLSVAAVVFVAVSLTGFLLLTDRTPATRSIDSIAPGGSKAVLTLADGTCVTIDDDVQREILEQNDIAVNVSNGQITYATDAATASTLYNTITIPRGGEYKLTLSDGTEIWVNSASTITYPVSFADGERRIVLSGEAYFEVSPDPDRPFTVESRGQLLTVLGTRFNIKAYEDEHIVTSTLVEGSVRVTLEGGGPQITLTPGMESLYDGRTDELVMRTANIESAISWKDGFINIEHNTLPQVLAKLSRWYDVDFRISDDVDTGFRFMGDIPRNGTLSSVVGMLERVSGTKFVLEGDVIEVHKR